MTNKTNKAIATAQDVKERSSERKRLATERDRTLSHTFSNLEYSVHVAPRGLVRDISSIFPGVTLDGLRIIPTFQKASAELLEYGEVQAREKDRLLERFLEWASEVRTALLARDRDAWLDATDPASGLAYFGTAAAPYSDVDGISRVTNYETTNAGGCTVVRHPDWGFACYPATIFSTADKRVLLDVLDKVNCG